MNKELKNLVKLLKRKATLESKKIGNDQTHYEGMCKGMYIGYEQSALMLSRILENDTNEGVEK